MTVATQDIRISGGCLCGAVRFTAPRPREFGVCHCKQCQRWTGIAFFGATLPGDAMEIEGAGHVVAFRVLADRHAVALRGLRLAAVVSRRRPRLDGSGKTADYEVGIGLFDDPDGLRLTKEIFIDRKCDSYDLAGDHERETEADYYARKPHVREATR